MKIQFDPQGEMNSFYDNELESYLEDFSHNQQKPDKTIYETYRPLDSNAENSFAFDCANREQVELYFKLPNWFKIATPIGTYNPDWPFVFKNENQIYFVAETKGKNQKLLLNEQLKIRCGKAHFIERDGIIYKQVTTLSDLARNIY